MTQVSEIKNTEFTMKIGDVVPNFEATTNMNLINFYEYLGSKWGMLFTWSRDKHNTATAELHSLGVLLDEFQRRNVHIVGLSCDSVSQHNEWLTSIEEQKTNCSLLFPVISDPDHTLCRQLGLLHKNSDTGLYHPVHRVILIGPDRKVRFLMDYPSCCERNMNEILRMIDSVQSKQKTISPPKMDYIKEGLNSLASWMSGSTENKICREKSGETSEFQEGKALAMGDAEPDNDKGTLSTAKSKLENARHAVEEQVKGARKTVSNWIDPHDNKKTTMDEARKKMSNVIKPGDNEESFTEKAKSKVNNLRRDLAKKISPDDERTMKEKVEDGWEDTKEKANEFRKDTANYLHPDKSNKSLSDKIKEPFQKEKTE